MAPKDGESEPPSSGRSEVESIQLDKSLNFGNDKGFVRLSPNRPRLVIDPSAESHNSLPGEIELQEGPLSSVNALPIEEADIQ